MAPWQRPGRNPGKAPGREKPRFLRPNEFAAALEFCHAAGPDGVLAGARLHEMATGAVPGGEVLVWPKAGRAVARPGAWWTPDIGRGDQIEALCCCSASLMVVGATAEHGAGFGRVLRPRGRRYSSLVGTAAGVLGMWEVLKDDWGQPRTLRPVQLLMAQATPPLVAPDPRVRPATRAELDIVAPAAHAMFTEELGFPPGGPAGSHRAHVARLIDQGNTLVRLSDAVPPPQRVEFKADLGAIFGGWAQVHGVWVDPALRGRGLAKAGMAAVVEQGLARGLQGLSLYVNDFNLAAVAAYRAVGFAVVGRWATVML
ncbi:MAG: GNAT family N-acetyltransferase [Bifidobacteriaceae bacterium]|jgi:predicted GNAT family acetyltransferase|nr:GNAT family N-acetyltransferase [Bifidobacteriaceae bacterium]